MKHVFQTLWIGGPLTPYEVTCFKSFLDAGHAVHLYTYASSLEVPEGVGVKDAQDVLRQDEYFTYKKGAGAGSHSAFSNLFRYKLLYERGGWWIDTDVICLSPEIPECEEFFAFESPEIVNGAVLRFESNDPIMDYCLQEASRIRDAASWGEIGPRLITRALRETGRIEAAMPEQLCYPIHHREALDLLKPSLTDQLTHQIQGSLFLHLWNEVFRRGGVAKTMLPPEGSLLRTLADRHGGDGWGGEYDTNGLEKLLSLKADLDQAHRELKALRREKNDLKKRLTSLKSQKATSDSKDREPGLSLWKKLKSQL